MYMQTLKGPGHPEPTIDVGPAVRLNGHYPLGDFSDRGDPLWLPLWLGFQLRGFAVKDEFIEQYITLAKAQRVGTSEEFRKAFCQAYHVEFEWKPESKPTAKPVKFYAAEVFGFAMVYSRRPGEKPLLWGIQKKGWNLQYPGRSISQPSFSLCRKVFVHSSIEDILKFVLYDLLEEKTGLSKEELERLIKKEMELMKK